ncbi:MAG: hypothetical protein WC331_09885 [Candidatus Omnitrophota bacterium]
MNEITTSLMCIQMRSGVEIWLDREAIERYRIATTDAKESKLIWFDAKGDGVMEQFNTADVVGTFRADRIADMTRRKNGGWQCTRMNWHDKGQKCDCISTEEKATIAKREEAIKNCGKCEAGFVTEQNENGEWVARTCDCQKTV